MFDDLATRAALTVGAFLLLSTGLSLVRLSETDAVAKAAHDLAAHLARQLDAIGQSKGEVRIEGGNGVEGPLGLPPNLGKSPYLLEVRATNVRVRAGETTAVARLQAGVHAFCPERSAYTSSELKNRDESTAVVVGNGERFVVERTLVEVDAVPTYLTFVCLPP